MRCAGRPGALAKGPWWAGVVQCGAVRNPQQNFTLTLTSRAQRKRFVLADVASNDEWSAPLVPQQAAPLTWNFGSDPSSPDRRVVSKASDGSTLTDNSKDDQLPKWSGERESLAFMITFDKNVMWWSASRPCQQLCSTPKKACFFVRLRNAWILFPVQLLELCQEQAKAVKTGSIGHQTFFHHSAA